MAKLVCILGMILCGWPSLVYAATVNIPTTMDNSIFSESLNSGGQTPTLFAGRNNSAGLRRALMKFNVADNVPAGSVVTDVFLTLYLAGASQSESMAREIALHRLLANWGEGASGGAGGQGQPAETGDATWKHRFFDDQQWASPGSDFVSQSSSISSVDFVLGFYVWDATPSLIADVQGWLDDPATNFGWVLISDESTNGTSRRFESDEAVDPTLRPALTIEYQRIPQPASIVIMVLCLLVLGSRQKRLRG